MMEPREKLAYYASLVQQGLETWLPDEKGELRQIFAAARYSALAPGKRLRPALLMEFYALCGGQAEDALPFACGLEMIHNYSLIHDDLPCMDDDDLRRGRPANHKVYGEAAALLAGDALLTRAFEVMLSQSCPRISPVWAMKAASIIAFCAGMEGMIGGQMMDLAFEKSRPQAQQLEVYTAPGLDLGLFRFRMIFWIARETRRFSASPLAATKRREKPPLSLFMAWRSAAAWSKS